jgi:hypothetical protein
MVPFGDAVIATEDTVIGVEVNYSSFAESQTKANRG